jgi:hypothetical protein
LNYFQTTIGNISLRGKLTKATKLTLNQAKYLNNDQNKNIFKLLILLLW